MCISTDVIAPNLSFMDSKVLLVGGAVPVQYEMAARHQYWTRRMGVNDTNSVPISDDAGAKSRRDATLNLSKLPSELRRLGVGSTWARSAEQSMMEYRLSDCAAESIDILRTLNISDRDHMQKKAGKKRTKPAWFQSNAMGRYSLERKTGNNVTNAKSM